VLLKRYDEAFEAHSVISSKKNTKEGDSKLLWDLAHPLNVNKKMLTKTNLDKLGEEVS
jgi:hypothetical protein